MRPSRHLHPLRLVLAFAVAVTALVAALLVGLAGAPVAAGAGGPVNVTMNIPADVRTNPCNGDPANLSGTLHIVIYTRSDSQGGYHAYELMSEKASGVDLVTRVGYQLSDTQTDSWYVGAPLPATHTKTYSEELVSKDGSPNWLMTFDVHTTIAATGIPTATVDNVRLACTG